MGEILGIFGIADEHGVPAAIIAALVTTLAAYIARDWTRMRRLEQHVDTLEAEFRAYTAKNAERCEIALNNSTTAIRNMNELARDFLNANRK